MDHMTAAPEPTTPPWCRTIPVGETTASPPRGIDLLRLVSYYYTFGEVIGLRQ
jgi:hypothetical protein